MSLSLLLAAALLAPAGAAASGTDSPPILIQRFKSRTGLTFRWFAHGRQVALALELPRAANGHNGLVTLGGTIPDAPAAEVDSKGRVIAHWQTCGEPPIIIKRDEFYPGGALKLLFVQDPKAAPKCPPDGLVVFFYRGGAKKSEAPVVSGFKSGVAREFYKNGRLKATYTYVSGLRDGPATLYRPNGTVEMIVHYRAGVEESTEKR